MNFKDIYTLPLVMEEVGGKVIDAKGQWVLDFTLWDKAKQRLLLEVINGVKTLKNNNLSFHHKDGYICDNNGGRYIIIRGWGNLVSKHNLSDKQASLVQDSFAQFIVEQLNRRTFIEQDLEDFLIFVEDNLQYHDSAWFDRDTDEPYSREDIIKMWKQKGI